MLGSGMLGPGMLRQGMLRQGAGGSGGRRLDTSGRGIPARVALGPSILRPGISEPGALELSTLGPGIGRKAASPAAPPWPRGWAPGQRSRRRPSGPRAPGRTGRCA